MMLALVLALSLTAVPAIFAEGQQEEMKSEKTAEEPKESSYRSFSGEHEPQWDLRASDPLLIGGYGDNFAYDGEDVTPLEGSATVDVNVAEDTGTMEVTFNGTINPEKGVTYSGDIRMVYEQFSAAGSEFKEGGIADYIYLHGDTGQEAPVMPTVRSYLASWGPVDIYVDGEKVYEKLVGHMMLTEGARHRDTYAIYAADGESFYSPKEPVDSSIAHPERRALHFVAHTTKQDGGNFPPHTVWIHVNFQDVEEM
jgi:hypothetical protein